jgi:DNA-binding FadR family transcriptional regulator
MAPRDTASLRSFSRQNVHGQVAHALGERIVRGELAPGSLLPSEAELSRRLGVSRTALREAIKLMAAKGLLESKRKSGTRVRPRSEWNMLDPDMLSWQLTVTPSTDFARNLFELRLMVEPQAVSFAAQRHQPGDLDILEEIWEGLLMVKDISTWVDLDIRFHRALFAAARNELVEALATLAEATLSIVAAIDGLPRKARNQALDQRRRIIDAIAAHDGPAAHDAMKATIEWTRDTLVSLLDPESRPEPSDHPSQLVSIQR